MNFFTRAPVPKDIASVTTIHASEEVPAHKVGGDDVELEKVWDQVVELYKTGIHPALQICLRRHGEVVMHRSIGYSHGNGPNDLPDTPKTVVTPETPFNIFSAAKAMTATVVHLLDEKNELHANDLVCEYIPEFTSHGKDQITIKHLLNHRAGIADPPPEAIHLDLLEDPDALMQLLYEMKPASRPGGRLAYHAVTSGFILAEIVRRTTGKDIRRVMHERFVKPLGFRWNNYGVAPRDLPKVAESYVTGLPIVLPLSNLFESVLGAPYEQVVEMSNDPRFLTAIIPSANVVTTANELCLFYQMLLNGGELNGTRVLEPRTIRRATAEQSWMEPDLKLIAPIRYAQGFMLGADYVSVFGPDSDKVFGHIGLSNIFGWADPERQIAGALMTSGKPVVYPGVWNWVTIPWQTGIALGKTEPRTLKSPTKRSKPRKTRSRKATRKVAAKKPAKRRKAASLRS